MAKPRTALSLLFVAVVASACIDSGHVTGPGAAGRGPRFDGGGGLGSGGVTAPGGGGLGSGGYTNGGESTNSATADGTCLLENGGGGLGSGGRTDCPTVTTP